MFWSASRLMSKPVRLLARRTDSYVHAHTVLRSPMRLFGAVAGASADSYDAGDNNDGIGNGAGVGSDAGAAADSGHAGTVAFAGTSAGTFAGTPSFYEAIDIADVVRARRLRRIRFILVRCVSVLLIVGAVVVASLPFAMQAHSARRLAETSDSAARTVAGWPYPMAMEELERARAYNRRLAVEGQPVLGEAAMWRAGGCWAGRPIRSLPDRLALPEMLMSPTIRRLPAVPGFPRRTRTRTIRACWIPAQASWARYWCPKSAWNCRFGMARPNRCSPSAPGICTAPACRSETSRSAALARIRWSPGIAAWSNR